MLTKQERVWRHLLASGEQGRWRWPGLAALGSELGIATSTIHRALAYPTEIGAVTVEPSGGFTVSDAGRLLLYWAAHRNLRKDITRKFRTALPVLEVTRIISEAAGSESASRPAPPVLGGFSALVTAMGKNTIADYTTVMVYGEPEGIPEDRAGDTEVIVLQPDPLLGNYGRFTTLAQSWADLFNLPGWQSSRFIHQTMCEVIHE